MRHNMAATGGKRQFQYHVVIRVLQKRPPKEMNFLMSSTTGQLFPWTLANQTG